VDKANVELFHEEEEKGAVAPTNGLVVKSTVLGGIFIKESQFQSHAQLLTGNDYPTLIKRGALLLLADEADKAVETFKTALGAAKNASERQTANTWIARSIKAQDGTIGRANEWITAAKAGAKP